MTDQPLDSAAPFQDNEGRWCRSLHVTTRPCPECGVAGFHKHYLTPAELTAEQWALMLADIDRLAAEVAALRDQLQPRCWQCGHEDQVHGDAVGCNFYGSGDYECECGLIPAEIASVRARVAARLAGEGAAEPECEKCHKRPTYALTGRTVPPGSRACWCGAVKVLAESAAEPPFDNGPQWPGDEGTSFGEGAAEQPQTYRALAACTACEWEGRRLWPSPAQPCPRCGNSVERVQPGDNRSTSRRDRRMTSWSEGAAGQPPRRPQQHDRWQLINDQPTCICGLPWRHDQERVVGALGFDLGAA